ncbi:hypothetical protein [Halomonas denitrificans]|uniref:hypothetical protein n=1 Tax=Halomonas denitrificans TaxID=370769 RepID=UPI000D398C6A|nr:hypothetical protein [Halomonas denitrificans]
MADVVYFSPRFEKDARRNLDDFICFCRNELTLYEEQGGFDVNLWRFNHKGKPIAMRFSRYSDKNNNYEYEPFSEPFLTFAKAYIRYQQSLNQVASVQDKMVALRAIHDALIEVHHEACPLRIDGLVQYKVVELLEKWFGKSQKLYRHGGQLERLYGFLIEKAITPSLPSWKRSWKKQKENAIRVDSKARKWQEERCPSIHQMLALADCFQKAKTVKDRYWSSVIALLMFAPGRGGELCELTVNSLHEEEGRLAVRWYSEKGFGENLKWVPLEMEAVVKEAFQRLIEIGGPARRAARFSYDHPGVFPWHDGCMTDEMFPQDKPLDALQFAAAMKLSQAAEKLQQCSGSLTDLASWQRVGINTQWIKELKKGGAPSYRKLAEYFGEKYRRGSWPYLPNTNQFVWDSLLLVRDYELHSSFVARPFSWILPSVNNLNDQLKARKLKNPMPTIFQRFGCKDEDGSEIQMTSHQLRVWLSTNAERGGMDSWRLAQFAGRARVKDNRSYDLRTEEEKDKQVRDILRLEERPTALQAIKMNLPVSYNDLGINRLGIADVTEYGMCTHDYAMSPCTKGGECMTCKEHVCIKGMPNTLDRILRLEGLVGSQLKKAQRDSFDGAYGADRWVTHLGWKLAHIKTQRLRLESDDTPEGAVLWIPPEHDPSPVKRALGQQGYEATPDEKGLVDQSTISDFLLKDE